MNIPLLAPPRNAYPARPLARPSASTPQRDDGVVFWQSVAQTSGQRTLVCVELPGGAVGALHRHHTFDETFRCVRGILGLTVGHTVLYLHPGETASVPRGKPHRVFNPSGGRVVFQIDLQPGSLRLERFLRVQQELQREGQTDPTGMPRNPLQAAALLELGDTHLSGPRGLLYALLACLGRRLGVGAALLERCPDPEVIRK